MTELHDTEERFEHIEQTLAQIDIQRDPAGLQREQAQVMLRVTRKLDALIDAVDKLVKAKRTLAHALFLQRQ
jgi:hypothetical protein